MSDEEIESVGMAECGACRVVIPIDSEVCPECGTTFSGVSEEELGECGACKGLVPLDSTRCSICGVLFVADDVVDVLRQWVLETGVNIRKLFDKFDENDDETIDSGELKKGLLSLNLADLPPSQVDRLVAEIDADGNGVIDLNEFENLLTGEAPTTTEDVSDQEAPSEEGDSDDQEDDGHAEAEEATSDVEPSDEAVEEPTETEELEEDHDEASEEPGDSVPEIEEEDGIENEDFDLDDEETVETDGTGRHPLLGLAEMMDEHDISAQRMFNDLDVDGNGKISLAELANVLEEQHGDDLDLDTVRAIMDGVDDDGDGMIDITEFIESMEDLETMETLVEEKTFPSTWQKRMMSKTWNDTVWPILHVSFGILVAIFIANGMFGFVDGSGGNVVYEPNDSGLIPSGIAEGDVYPCDDLYQKDGCRNSLTPLAGVNGELSMPTGFYWDGILIIGFAAVAMLTSLFLHLVKVREWRARAKAMKEFEEDKTDASEATDESDEESANVENDGDEEFIEDDESEDVAEEDYEDDEGEEDAIDIGSHIGLVFDDEEVFGTIIEFDDEEETVTIEEDETGDIITGYQEDMFLE